MEFLAKTLKKVVVYIRENAHIAAFSQTHTQPMCHLSLHSGLVAHERKSHLLLQVVTIIEKIYPRKLANSISAGGPEMMCQ